jgi:hypothetical protein
MFTLRCTARLLKLVGASSAVSAPPTTRLGDWYANIVWGRPRVLLCVSERTLLPVLIPGYGLRGVVPELQRSVSEVLLALGIPRRKVDEEHRAMETGAIGRTANRRVLGSMNDFAWQLDSRRGEPVSLLELSLWLADTPCGPLSMRNPMSATPELFASAIC